MTTQTSTNFKDISSSAIDVLDSLSILSENYSSRLGVPTGFEELDQFINGLCNGRLIVLASRPSMGKTTLATNIASHVAITQELPVVIFSLEAPPDETTRRLIASLGRIDTRRLESGNLLDEEWAGLSRSIETIRDSSIHIATSPCSIDVIRTKASEFKEEVGSIGLIVVDYLQLMIGSGYPDRSRSDELAEISRGLKSLAIELDCPILALSQLNRSLETRQDKRPVLGDARDCGAIEEDADVVLFLYCDEYYTRDACREPGIAEVIVAKQRMGPTGTIKLAFLRSIARFENLLR